MGGSYYMEKEGLSRSVLFLQLSIGNIITDHHKTIQKWISNTLPDTTHLYDVWHIAKGQFIYISQTCMYIHFMHACLIHLYMYMHRFEEIILALSKRNSCGILNSHFVSFIVIINWLYYIRIYLHSIPIYNGYKCTLYDIIVR